MKTRLAALLTVLALTACKADNNASVRIDGMCAPPTSAKPCTFAATCGAFYLGDVAIDASLTNRLWLAVQVSNLQPANGDAGTNRTNTNDASVREYEVEFPGLGTVTAPLPGGGHVPAAGTAVLAIPVVNEAITAGGVFPTAGYTDFVTKVRLKGVFADTTSFTTGDFQVTVRGCNGGGCGSQRLTCDAAAGEVLFTCPGDAGQLPIVMTCAKP